MKKWIDGHSETFFPVLAHQCCLFHHKKGISLCNVCLHFHPTCFTALIWVQWYVYHLYNYSYSSYKLTNCVIAYNCYRHFWHSWSPLVYNVGGVYVFFLMQIVIKWYLAYYYMFKTSKINITYFRWWNGETYMLLTMLIFVLRYTLKLKKYILQKITYQWHFSQGYIHLNI